MRYRTMAKRNAKYALSVVIPTFNEELNVQELHQSLRNVLRSFKSDYEIVFVDDGSVDNTFDRLKSIRQTDARVKIVKLRANFGQSAALTAGFRQARGETIVTMDADLQNDPADIPSLLGKLAEGYDVVAGYRWKRRDSFFSKQLPSLISNSLARRLTGVKIHDFGCTLRAYRRGAIENVELYGEGHRFFLPLIAMQGFRIAEVRVSHRYRQHGKSKYGLARLVRGFLDLLFVKFWLSYSTRPLHLFGLWGLLLMLAGAVILASKLSQLLFLAIPLTAGPLLLLSALLEVMGLQLVLLGFLGEVLIRILFAGKPHIAQLIERVLD
jgi:glycosyltransferase involved in cell wall biosynthesis